MSTSSLKIERKTVRCSANEARNLFAAIPAKAQRSLPGHALATIIDALSTEGTADLAATLALLFPSEPLDKARRRLTTEIANRVYVDDNGNAPLKIVQTRKGEEPALIWLERRDLADTRGLTEAGDRYAPDQFVPAEATRQTSAEIVSDIAAEKMAVNKLAVDSANETASDNDKTLLSKNVARDSASPAFTNVRNQVIANSIKPNNAANDSLRGSNLSADQFTATDATRVEGFAGFTESAKAEPDARNTVNALDAMLAWAADKQSTAPKLLALLGDYGTGKTSHALQFSRVLNGDVAHPKRPDATLSALHIDLAYLRGVPGLAHLNVTQIVAIVIEVRGLSSVLSAETVVREVREGRRILVYDGLDELMQSDHAQLHSVFRQLLQVLEPDPVRRAPSNARLIVSCRTHYFRDLTEQHEFFNTQMRRGVTRKDYLCLYLLPWKPATVRDYLNRRLSPDEASALSDTIAKTYNLEELASRPVLLAMMCEQVGEVLRMRDAGGGAVTASTLYAQTVAMWVRRDDEKHVLQATHKPVLMGALACAMWNDGKEYWDADRLDRWLRRTVDALFPGHYSPEQTQAIQDDLRTATFVARPTQTGFTFAHRSFSEFFLARHLVTLMDWDDLSDVTLRIKAKLLPVRHFNRESKKFLTEMLRLSGDRRTSRVKRLWSWLGYELPNEVQVIDLDLAESIPKSHAVLVGIAFEMKLDAYPTSPRANLRSAYLPDVCVDGLKMPMLDVRNADLREARFMNCQIASIWAEGAQLTNTTFLDCTIKEFIRAGAATDGLLVRRRSARPRGTYALNGPWTKPFRSQKNDQSRSIYADERIAIIVVQGRSLYCWNLLSGQLRWNAEGSGHRYGEVWWMSEDLRYVMHESKHKQIFEMYSVESGVRTMENLPNFDVPKTAVFCMHEHGEYGDEIDRTPVFQSYQIDAEPHADCTRYFSLLHDSSDVAFDSDPLMRFFTPRRRSSTACFDTEGRLVDYDEEAADTWLRYLGNGYPQPVEAAWLELDEFGRALGPKKPRS